jgi:hypothetical protein
LYVIELSRYANTEGIKRDVALVSLQSKPKTFNDSLKNAIKCLIFLNLTEPEIIHLGVALVTGQRIAVSN